VEKAIKALLSKHGIPFPYVHDIGELLILLEDVGQFVPEIIRQSARSPALLCSLAIPILPRL
jgi:HEPN domain-containing protein